MKTKFIEIKDTNPSYIHIYRWIQNQVPESYKSEFQLSYNQFMRNHKIKVLDITSKIKSHEKFKPIHLSYRLPEELLTFIIMSTSTNV